VIREFIYPIALFRGVYEKILVPVDESELSERTVNHALEMAEKFSSELHVIYVADDRSESHLSKSVSELSLDAPERREIGEQRKQTGKKLIEAVIKRAHERGIDTEHVIIGGNPAEVITEYATKEGMSVIAIGAKGRSAVGKFLLGDVAGKVARHATMPVLLVRPNEN